MTAVVVADAGPLIGLARIGRVSLLTSLYGSVVIPDRVLTELHVDSDRPGARALSAALAAGAIRPQALPEGSAAELARLCLLLDAGEASAILLAEQMTCRFLLIDERRGRQIARARGIPVVGLAGVLLAAKRSGLLPSVASTLADLSREGYRLSDALVSEVLRLAGEADSVRVTQWRSWGAARRARCCGCLAIRSERQPPPLTATPAASTPTAPSPPRGAPRRCPGHPSVSDSARPHPARSPDTAYSLPEPVSASRPRSSRVG